MTLYNVMRKFFFFFNANGNYYIYFNDKDVVGQYKYTSVRKYMHVGNSHLVPIRKVGASIIIHKGFLSVIDYSSCLLVCLHDHLVKRGK